MSQEARREAIVRATVPLLYEHGANVTTSQIAKAAGIAEGTVFRAFKDKQELLATCVRTALASRPEVEVVEAIDLDAPLPERLLAAITAVSGYLDRMWGLMSTLRDSGYDPRDGHDHQHDGDHEGPQQEMQRVLVRIAALFQPEADRLAVEPVLAARLLMGIVFTNRMRGRGMGDEVAEPSQLVDLFLHGVLSAGRTASHTPEGEAR
jgi:AcrR family transcriptional regulator